MIDSQQRAGVGPRPERARLEAGRMMDLQRARMIAAVIAGVEAEGYPRLTVAAVIARSRISRKTFYDAFLDLEDIFLAAFEQTLARASEIARSAYAHEPDWRSGMRAALVGLLTAMDEERGLARLCVVDALLAGPRVLGRRAQVLAQLARAIDGGRELTNARSEPPPLTAQAIAGAIAALLHARLLERDPVPLAALSGSLMSMIVMPYLGRAAARREFSAPPPPAGRGGCAVSPRRGLDPLAQLDMRITYRTVRVLGAIAETPDASNAQIAEHAGIVDPSQVSKLLARLARLGLVENVRPGGVPRGVNAWRLTDFGTRVQRATRGHR
ncbi:MAG TPA: TetR/AcrR family transcriptional regulator [Solirubrobacteraceae bacterium]|nr:TetR/AcrR family transcriptional regulator [Solirubrobacteraceae bacterium]